MDSGWGESHSATMPTGAKPTKGRKKQPRGTKDPPKPSEPLVGITVDPVPIVPKPPDIPALPIDTKYEGIPVEQKVGEIISSGADLPTQVLSLSKSGDWAVLEKLLKTIGPANLDLSVFDEQTGLTSLMLAIRHNQLTIANLLTVFGADPKQKTKDGLTLAHIAAEFSNAETFAYVAEKGIDLHSLGGPKQQLAIHLAAHRSDPASQKIAQFLLKSITQESETQPIRLSKDKDGKIPIVYACEANNSQVFMELLRVLAKEQIAWKDERTGEQLIHIACRLQNPMIVQELITLECNPNVVDGNGRTPLHIAAATGNDAIMKILYRAKADATVLDKDHKTALHVAAETGNTQVVEVLIDKFKASVAARTKDGSTLMHVASKAGHPDTAIAFLKRGVPLLMPNKDGLLGLHGAALMGHVGVVKTLLEKGTDVNCKSKDGYTPLHVAIHANKPDVAECLLGYGADVHVRGMKLDETPLHIAAALTGDGSCTCAEMLIKSGAEVNDKNAHGETPLHICAATGNMAMMKLLLDEDDADVMAKTKLGDSILVMAAKFCNFPIAKVLIEFVAQSKGRDVATKLVNMNTNLGETPLHFVAELTPAMYHYPSEAVDLIRLLLDYGGEITSVTTLTYETPIHLCARNGCAPVLSEILNKIGPGAAQIAINKQSKVGWSPLLEAAEKGHIEVVKILLNYNARIDVFDEHGKTALHLSSESGHVQVVEVLLQNKAFVNSRTKFGVTPLHLAAMQSHKDVVCLLVQDYGAAVDALTLENLSPLHLAAKHGHLAICEVLLAFGADPNVKDIKGRSPLYMAAESDYPEVVQLFLRFKSDTISLNAIDEEGYTCAHIAAMKGSVAVVRELMKDSLDMVLTARTKNTESTVLHLAASSGHQSLAQLLIASGASPFEETSDGMTALHLAAMNGCKEILHIIDRNMWGYCSQKNGMSAIHVACFYGQIEFVQEMLPVVSATVRSEAPMRNNPLLARHLAHDFSLTPLHMAAISGDETLIRIILNCSGVQVAAPTVLQRAIPLHLAAQYGHVPAVGLLLSRSTDQLNVKDLRGRTALHYAAKNGHKEMVALLLAQGAMINAGDKRGWTALHFATDQGHIDIVKLLAESNADTMAETVEEKTAVTFAAAARRLDCLYYLLEQPHNSYNLLEDTKFAFDLVLCGRANNNLPIENFILTSSAPIDIAVKLSSVYETLSSREKERARDLISISRFCEEMAVNLATIVASDYSAIELLTARDWKGANFLDTLIETQQKKTVAHVSVQQYLTEVWNGGLGWPLWKFFVLFLLALCFPPAWIYLSLPLNNRLCRTPAVKFVGHIVSHIYFTLLIVIEVIELEQKVYDDRTWVPTTVEWVLLLFLAGFLTAELDAYGNNSIVRVVVLVLCAVAMLFHVAAFVGDAVYNASHLHTIGENFTAAPDLEPIRETLLYTRNQFFAVSGFICFVEVLEFLNIHHLFGPWAIIIQNMFHDLMRYLVILALFISGFTIVVYSIFIPAYAPDPNKVGQDMNDHDVLDTFRNLYFALFQLVGQDDMPDATSVPGLAASYFRFIFGLYMMVGFVVLINLLIAMMTNTYERIHARSDTEWKFARAQLIRQMNKMSAVPTPINLLTKFLAVAKVALKYKGKAYLPEAQEDMRREANLDSYHVGDLQGMSPTAVGGSHHDLNGHRGSVIVREECRIEEVVQWDRVVATYRTFHSATTKNDKNLSDEQIFLVRKKIKIINEEEVEDLILSTMGIEDEGD